MNINRVKGQISIFIVIGIILVFGFIFLISTSFTDMPIFSDEKNTYNVKEFVESCLLLETQTAITKLGASGGWLYPKSMMYTNKDNNKELNKMASGFDFLEKNKMPYWYYYEDSEEVFKTYIPEYDTESPTSLKSQLKKYLDENLEINCFKGFDNFKDIYNVKYDRKEIETKVVFLDKEIIVDLNLDLEVENIVDLNTDYISSFKMKTENKLYLPYHMAIEIIKAEINSSFMDTRIMQILRPYQSSDGRDLLPPQSETKLNFDFDVWYMDDVEKTVKQIISSEISRVQFLNTNYNQREIPQSLRGSEFVQAANAIYTNDYLKENTNLDEENSKLFKQFKDLKVTPTFEPFYPIFFRIKQAIGDTILLPSPELVGGFLPIFYTKYKASYEIAAPIVFEIKSDKENDDFIFNLPIEINIKHNTALKNNYAIVEDSSLNNDIPKPKKSLICDPSQYVSDVVSVDLIDPINYGKNDKNSPATGVEDAMIQFTCKEISECHIMQTKLGGDENVPEDLRDTTTSLKFRLPINCNPGTLEISKFGHQKITYTNLNPKIDEPLELGTVEMSSGKELRVDIGLRAAGSGTFGAPIQLKEHESGFMIFENLEDENIIEVINVNRDNRFNITINLIPGKYKITGLVIYENLINIPEQIIPGKKGTFGIGSTPDVKLRETNLSSWLRGGYSYDEFTVTTEQLLNADTLDIAFIEYTIPTNYDELEESSMQMAGMETSSNPPRFENK